MNTSSFLTGILIGAAATKMISKNKGMMGQGNGSVGEMADKARDKVMDFATMGMMGNGSNGSECHHNSTQGSSSTSETSSYSKESNMGMVKDFIRSNPDVKLEVDMILKETNTVIPGL